MDAVQRQCLLAPDKTWKLIEGVVVQILNQVLQFAELQQRLRKPVSPFVANFCIKDVGCDALAYLCWGEPLPLKVAHLTCK